MRIVLFLAIVANCADLLATAFGIHMFGNREGNPFLADVARRKLTALFVEGTRDLLKPGGRYYIVTKMPTAVVPMIFETYGDCSVIENRGYSVVMAAA